MSDDKDKRIKELEERVRFVNSIIHNMVVANQSAWIEWQEGKGAEKAMTWIHNGLVGPGHIPSNEIGATPDQWFNKNMVEYTEQQPTH